MDDALRQAERVGSWRNQAALLRRAGRTAEARRLLEERVRAGFDEGVRLLDEWYPLDEEARAILQLLGDDDEPTTPSRRWFMDRGVTMFVGDSDPRLDQATIRFAAARADGHRRVHGDGGEWEDIPALLARPWLERICEAADRFGALALARTHPTSCEALDLYDRLADSSGEGARLLSVIWLLGCFGDPSLAEERLRAVSGTAAERCEARHALRRLGRACDLPRLPTGEPVRPPWVPDVCPGRSRDGLTPCLTRRVFGGPGGSWTPASTLSLADFSRWLLYVDLDWLQSINDRYGFLAADLTLQAVADVLIARVGDRAIRWGGEEFLVPYEGEDGPRVAEEIRREVEALQIAEPSPGESPSGIKITVTVVVLENPPAGIAEPLRILDEAMGEAKLGGRNRVVVVS